MLNVMYLGLSVNILIFVLLFFFPFWDRVFKFRNWNQPLMLEIISLVQSLNLS